MAPASVNAKTADWPAYNAIYFDVRPTAGGYTSEPGGGVTVTLPYWVRVVRNGNTFSSYYSPDGVKLGPRAGPHRRSHGPEYVHRIGRSRRRHAAWARPSSTICQ